MKNILLLLFLSFFIVSCSTQTFYVNGKHSGKSATMQAKVDDSDTFFVAGVFQKKSHNPVKICGGINKVVKVETQQTFMNIVFNLITLGIYSPKQFRVYCKAK